MLESLTCGEGKATELTEILLVPEKQQPLLKAYRSALCSGKEGQRSERFKEMSIELREQIDTQSVAEKVHTSNVYTKFVCFIDCFTLQVHTTLSKMNK